MEKNYFYKILGVSPDATQKEIEEGFHRALKSYYPDSGSSNDEMAKEVLQAYRVLSDEEKRKKYDQEQWKNLEKTGDDFGKKRQQESLDEQKAIVCRLKEGQQIIGEIERMLTGTSELKVKVKEKTGWTLFVVLAVLSYYFFALGISGRLVAVLKTDYAKIRYYQIAQMICIILPLAFLCVAYLKHKGNQAIDKFNAIQIQQIKEERKKNVSKAKELLTENEKTLLVLPQKFWYQKAFREIGEYMEMGYAGSIDDALEWYERTKWHEDIDSGIHTITTRIRVASEDI